MSSLSQTYLRQARSFMRAGDAARAVELLEKARALARDDKVMLREVTIVLAEAYGLAGEHDRALRCREQLRFLPAPPADSVLPSSAQQQDLLPSGTFSLPQLRRRPFSRMKIGLWIAVLVCHGALFYVGYRVFMARTAPVNSGLSGSGGSDTLPTTNPASVAPVLVPAATQPLVPVAAPTSSQLEIALEQNVALLLVLGHYEGSYNGRQLAIDLPLASGTAFVVTKSGILLTNKHVVESARQLPATLQELGLPTLTLRESTFLACFGPESTNHISAKMMFASERFDLAVLATGRTFPAPLHLETRMPTQGEAVLAVGFPVIVQEVANTRQFSDARVQQAIKQLIDSGKLDVVGELFNADSYKSTLTRGVISTAERNIDEVSHTQFDAKVSPGNSGGPLLNSFGKVMAIVTLAGKGEASGYNYGLLLNQLKDELAPYVPDK